MFSTDAYSIHIFDRWLVEWTDSEAPDMKGQLYMYFPTISK